MSSVATLLVGYGYPPFAALDGWAALESALSVFLYESKESK
ncbi:hypothetical protein ACFT7S_14575 [Streptomyces sp. NPDC057136]